MNVSELIVKTLRKGEDNAITKATFVSTLNLSAREYEKTIEHLRRKGVVICSSDKGYFYPASKSELETYVRRESARVRTIRDNLKPAKNLLSSWVEE